MRTKTIFIATAATVAAVGLGTGIAVAAWSASGTGTGTGAALTAQSLSVTAVSGIGASGESLYPGGPAGWVYMNIRNPNPYAITVTGLQWGTPTSANTTSCPNSDISLDPSAPTSGFNISIGAGATLSAVQVNGVLDLSHAAPDGCQGVDFNIPVTVTGVQQ